MVKLKKLSEIKPHNLTTIYGMPGKGKTKLISSMPGKILVADADNGLSTIMNDVAESGQTVDVATVESWEDFLEVLDEVKNYDSFAIDHLTKIQQFLYDYLIENDKKAKRMTLQLYGYAKEEMISVIDRLVRFANAGKNIYVICQEKQINLEDEDEDLPKIITADLQGSIRDYLLASCSLVANARTYQKKEKIETLKRIEAEMEREENRIKQNSKIIALTKYKEEFVNFYKINIFKPFLRIYKLKELLQKGEIKWKWINNY